MGKSIKQTEKELITKWIDSVYIPRAPIVDNEDNKKIVNRIKSIFESAVKNAADINNLPF